MNACLEGFLLWASRIEVSANSFACLRLSNPVKRVFDVLQTSLQVSGAFVRFFMDEEDHPAKSRC